MPEVRRWLCGGAEPAPAPAPAAAADDDEEPGTPGGEDRAAPTTPSKMPLALRALQDHMCAPENAPPIEPAPEELVGRPR